ncbi:MAG: addiction module protein [Betaproteobacteria bacterium]
MSEAKQETSPRVQEILEQTRALSAAERAQLVNLVLESLDEPDPAIDAVWQAEVERRADGMDDGSRAATPWSEARKSLGL